jgi:hypothetical protein
LRVELEIENTADQARAVHWNGASLGMATFQLSLPDGTEVPPPDWAWGGNEPTGPSRRVIPAHSSVKILVGDNIFAPFGGRRALRIGAFWGREMPSDGSSRRLGARLEGHAPVKDEAIIDASDTEQRADATEPPGHAWQSRLDVPPVCIE